jgi:hypothetical protein
MVVFGALLGTSSRRRYLAAQVVRTLTLPRVLRERFDRPSGDLVAAIDKR